MKNRIIIAVLLAVVITIVALFVLTGCSKSTTPPSSPGVSNLDGKSLMETRCIVCHSLGRIQAKKADLQGWTTTVQRMVSNGTQLTTDEQKVLEQYLAATYK